jgi:hypothetical protein
MRKERAGTQCIIKFQERNRHVSESMAGSILKCNICDALWRVAVNEPVGSSCEDTTGNVMPLMLYGMLLLNEPVGSRHTGWSLFYLVCSPSP